MKKILVLLLVSVLCWGQLFTVSAETGKNTALFTQEQLAALRHDVRLSLRQVVQQGEALYAYASNGEIYVWQVGEENPSLYAKLPPIPEGTYLSYSELDAVTKAVWEEMVSFIVPDEEGGLLGVNIYNGKLGKIVPDGICWGNVRLSLSKIWPEDARWPMRIMSAFVAEKKLYAYVMQSTEAVFPFANYVLISFDLQDGASTSIEIENAQAYSMYKSGEILLLHYGQSEWNVSVLRLFDGVISASSFLPIILKEGAALSGLAYDAKSERLLYTSEGQVWAGKAGEEYKAIATVPIGPDVPSMVGFALPDGRYAIADHALYLRAEGQKLPPDNEIIVQGWADEAAYRSFSKENAGFRVLFQMEFKSSDDIAQALISGDESADIYVVPMDNTFRAIVKKGYTLPLSGSSILAEETAKMYPHIQRAIRDENGSPVAYPFSFSLVNWLYNELLWKRVFGEEALPESYIEFLDAMLRWEKEYADAHTNIVFSRDFDYVFWLQNIINDFSRQYGKGNEALSFANTHLRAALEKLAQVVSARRTNGRSIRAGGEGEQEGEKQEIFITFGDNDALRDPDALRPLESYEQDGIIQEGIYESMPSLLFEKGQAAFIPGSMLVAFVNPFSRKKDMAVVCLEHAAKTKSDIKLYYALQLERNMPIENPEYARELEELKEQLALYQKGLENASAAEKGNIEIKLREMEKRIENHHFHRWLISEKAISTYRSFASSVRFYDDNPYVLERGSRMLAQLEDVFERYADGNMSLDAFLQEIEGKMRLMYLERALHQMIRRKNNAKKDESGACLFVGGIDVCAADGMGVGARGSF